MARRVDQASKVAAPAPANESAYHIFRCREVSYGWPRNPLAGANDLGAPGVYRGSMAIPDSAAFRSASVAIFGWGAVGGAGCGADAGDSLAEILGFSVEKFPSAFIMPALCGAEHTNKIAANSMNHLSSGQAILTFPARNTADSTDSLFAPHWAIRYMRCGTSLWIFRFRPVGRSYHLTPLRISNQRCSGLLLMKFCPQAPHTSGPWSTRRTFSLE